MQKNLLDKNDDISKIAEKYAMKYFSDLQKHFDLTNKQLIRVLKICVNKIKAKEFVKEKFFVKKIKDLFQYIATSR
jgi:hypothetical protein